MINNLEIRPKYILIKPKKKTESGIYIPENAEAIMNEPQLVIHAGKDLEFVKEGDYVIIEPHALKSMTVNDEDYFLIPEFRIDGKVMNYTPKEEVTKSPFAI